MLYSPTPMHIPDGFLSTLVAVVFWIVSAIAIGCALQRVGRDLGERQVPLMGVLAAAIFAGQMLNFTVAGGTSGHLLGAALATILLGPWAAMIVMTTVVGVQALIFQDGGLLALGANLFNMAILGVAVSYFVFVIFKKLARGQPWGLLAGGAAAAWCSVVASALACGLELALSGKSPANLAVPAMGGIHALIGIGEGLITTGALTFLYAARRDLLHLDQPAPQGGAAVWIFGLLLAILLAVLSPLASTHPDGLESVAGKLGFISSAREPLVRIMPDYIIPGISNAALATVLAGIAGVGIVFGAALGMGYWRRNKKA